MSKKVVINCPSELAAATERAKSEFLRDIEKAKKAFKVWMQRKPKPNDWIDWFCYAGSVGVDNFSATYVWKNVIILGQGRFLFTD